MKSRSTAPPLGQAGVGSAQQTAVRLLAEFVSPIGLRRHRADVDSRNIVAIQFYHGDPN